MQMRHKFEAAGGKVMEKTLAQAVRVHPDGVALQLQSDEHDITGQLLIDCMGNFSPIVRQVLRPSHHIYCHLHQTQKAAILVDAAPSGPTMGGLWKAAAVRCLPPGQGTCSSRQPSGSPRGPLGLPNYTLPRPGSNAAMCVMHLLEVVNSFYVACAMSCSIYFDACSEHASQHVS